MHRSNFIMCALIALVSGLGPKAAFADEQPAPLTYFFALPEVPGTTLKPHALALINAIVAEAQPQTAMTFYGGGRHLADCTISAKGPARMRIVGRSLAPVLRHLDQPAPQGQEADILDVPALVPLVAATTKGRSCRLILVGRMAHNERGDQSQSFDVGSYPSMDHIAADKLTSVFGTNGLSRSLDKVCVDWLVMGESTQRQRAYALSFWSSYFEALGGSLTTALDAPAAVAKRVTAGATDTVPTTKLQPIGRLAILKVPESVSAANVAGKSVGIVIVQDGSASMGQMLLASRTAIVSVFELALGHAAELQGAVLIHRGPGATVEFGPMAISPASGLRPLAEWSEQPRLPVEQGKNGLKLSTSPTKETALVNVWEPISGGVNVSKAIERGCELLTSMKSARPCLLVAGDMGPSESISADPDGARRAIEAVRRFAANNPDFRLIVVYVNSGAPRDPADSDFFEQLVQAAGAGRGRLVEDLNVLHKEFEAAVFSAGGAR